jgi:hypothetical protein
MTPMHLAPYCGIHLDERFRLAFERKTTGHVIERGTRKAAGWAQQNSVAGLFDGEFRSRPPGAGIA